MSATTTTITNNTLVETTISNATQVVNFALNSGKLLANGSENNGRVLMAKVPTGNNSLANATFSLPIILVLIFILASIVGVIVTALFVMRNRFSTWRLDRSKSAPVDGEDGIKAEPATPPPTEAMTITTGDKEESSAASDAPLIGEGVVAPASETTTPVETTTAVVVVEESEVAVVGKEVVTSSSSLIVNVLNELSESVACKLESMDPEKEPLKGEVAKNE